MKRTTPLTRHIGGKVREYRLKNGWTQTELAARMQVVGRPQPLKSTNS